MPVPPARFLTVGLATCLLVPTTALAIDVDLIALTAGSFREDGVPGEYFLSFSLEGIDIASARVLRPGIPTTEICVMIQEGDNDWNCDLGGFSSLDDICQTIGFGEFLFELTASAGSDDSATVVFDPGCTDPIAGYADITAPLPGGTVPPVPGPDEFCWDCSAPGECGPGTTVVSLFDMGDTDLAVELLQDVRVPACWDPGICIPTGPDDEFEVSAIQMFADFERRTTALDDVFAYLSAYESQNITLYDVTDPVPTTPPAVADGDGVSSPMEAARLISDGSSIELIWDVESCCGITDHHLVHGTRADLPASPGGTFAIDGSACVLGATGSFAWNNVPAPSLGDFVWWIVLANDGGSTEGSWGEDGDGLERIGPAAGGGSGRCGMTAKDVSNACGR